MVPLLEFCGFKPAKNIPEEIKEASLKIKNETQGKKEFLEKLYSLILEKNSKQWQHTRFQAATKINRLWARDLNEIWYKEKFIYCHSMNYLAYNMLLESGWFQERDMQNRHVFANFVPHQYLRINIEGAWVDFDPAGTGIRGKPLGTHLAGFG